MELSYETVRSILERIGERDGWQWCSEYGEPGYSTRVNASTPMVVLGNYWCRCDKFGVEENGRTVLHSFDQHWPRVWQQMEKQGVSFEWEDEWTIDYETDKAYRTSSDSYGWQSVIHWGEDCELLTPDSDLEQWLEAMVNNPRMYLPSRVWSSGDLESVGFEAWNGRFERGWHPGQTDDPEAITREIREAMGDDVEIVFLLDESSQFYVGFSAWTRGEKVEDEEDEEDEENESLSC